jgi:glycosyltransferase involved in cell wall biosynthesis
MKVALLAAANDIHTARWANGLVSRGIEVHLFSIHASKHVLDERVSFHKLPFGAPPGYFLSTFSLKKILSKIKPDILNAHFAFGYGLLGRLSCFKPFLLSVYGRDVYDYPHISFIHKKIVYDNLRSATALGSTSKAMAVETEKTFEHEQVFITPFGIDVEKFKPKSKVLENPPDQIIIGTVKKLTSKYGIDVLIKAFNELITSVQNNSPETVGKLKLVIAGKGPDKQKLEKLVHKLGLDNKVTFLGFIDHAKVPDLLNTFDVYVALSRDDSESFGVAILEANSCGVPVVVTDADGPYEVTIEGETGFIVPKENVELAADALEKLVLNKNLRQRMGEEGRKHVLKNYSWERSLDIMIEAYNETIQLHK